jgi:hypothetical protein
MITQLDLNRFWNKVSRINNIDDCWIWVGARHPKKQYGNFFLNGEIIGAHRVSYIIHYGSIPTDLHVLHKCNNPPCINPYHLYVGTHFDNMQDINKSNRRNDQTGQKNPNHILTDEKVIEMITKIWNNEFITVREVANYYKVTRENIYYILNGRKWTNITSQLQVPLSEIKLKLTSPSFSRAK